MPTECPLCAHVFRNREYKAHLNKHEQNGDNIYPEEDTPVMPDNEIQAASQYIENETNDEANMNDNQDIISDDMNLDLDAFEEDMNMDLDGSEEDMNMEVVDPEDTLMNTFILPASSEGSEVVDKRNASFHKIFDGASVSRNTVDELIKWVNKDRELNPGNFPIFFFICTL